MVFKIPTYDFGLCRTHNGFQFTQACFANAFHAVKLPQERLLALLSDSLYVIQLAGNLSFAAFLAMEGNRVTMHFILDLREQAE